MYVRCKICQAICKISQPAELLKRAAWVPFGAALIHMSLFQAKQKHHYRKECISQPAKKNELDQKLYHQLVAVRKAA